MSDIAQVSIFDVDSGTLTNHRLIQEAWVQMAAFASGARARPMDPRGEDFGSLDPR